MMMPRGSCGLQAGNTNDDACGSCGCKPAVQIMTPAGLAGCKRTRKMMTPGGLAGCKPAIQLMTPGGLAGCKPAVQILTPGDVAGCKPASHPTHRNNVPHSWQRRGKEENHGFASNARLRDLRPCKSTLRCAKKAWWNSGQPAKTSQVVAMEIQAADSKRLRGKHTRLLHTVGLVHEDGKI